MFLPWLTAEPQVTLKKHPYVECHEQQQQKKKNKQKKNPAEQNGIKDLEAWNTLSNLRGKAEMDGWVSVRGSTKELVYNIDNP